jgi:hypothetical protein
VQIADLPEKSLVGGGIERLASVFTVPLVNLCLQRIPLRQQSLVLRTQRCPNIGHALPEMIRIDAGAGRDLVDHQCVERLVDVKVGTLDSIGHGSVPAVVRFSRARLSARALSGES